jgi:pimeloyl-ACP methyl ester carboxylesterase
MGAAASRAGGTRGAEGGGGASAPPTSTSTRPPLPPPATTPLSINPAIHAHPTHLVVLVHGIVGSPKNWAYIVDALGRRAGADGRGLAVLASAANALEVAGPRGTFEGVDVCGARVAAEVRAAVDVEQAARAAAGAPPLDRISVVGHSMGGLVARNAIAHLFEGGSGDKNNASPPTIAGLRPVSFTTIATPHTGCTGSPSSAAQVPLVAWLRPPRALAAALDGPVAATMGSTGRQFFLRDGSTSKPPLLVRMAADTPGDLPFLRALAAFPARSAYANSGGDHLVGWANASLRYTDELPDLRSLPRGRGVVADTGLESAFAHPPTHRAGAAAEAAAPAGPGASAVERREVAAILEGLRSLPWRRLDVCYRDTVGRGAAAHNLIQVTRTWCRWLDPDAAAAEHVCDAIVAVDARVLEKERVEKGKSNEAGVVTNT